MIQAQIYIDTAYTAQTNPEVFGYLKSNFQIEISGQTDSVWNLDFINRKKFEAVIATNPDIISAYEHVFDSGLIYARYFDRDSSAWIVCRRLNLIDMGLLFVLFTRLPV